MKRKMLTLAVSAIFILLTGCQNTINSIEYGKMTYVPGKQHITDGFLRDRLPIVSINAPERTPLGHMKVQITAKNARVGVFSQMWSGMTDENPYPLVYRFTWLDENEMAMPTNNSAWIDTTVRPGGMVYFTSVAPHARCTGFIFEVKEKN